jgi:branched-chain amino acid transport system permease protein
VGFLNTERVSLFLRQKWWLLLLVIIAVSFPPLMGRYWISLANEILVQSMFAMSFSLLYGYMGRLSFGQGAFFGVGGYIMALLLTKTSISFPVALGVGVAGAAMCAAVVGYFCVRLTGIYFAILTSVAAEVVFYITFTNYSFLGGDNGIPNIYPPAALRGALMYYYFSLAVTGGLLVVYWLIVNSPFGYSLRCIRDNIERATFVGIPVRRNMLIAFVISGAFAGLAGAIFVPFSHIVSPTMCGVFKSMEPVFMSIIGGVRVLFGPTLGATLWMLMESIVLSYTEYWPLVIGCIVLPTVLFMPGGVLGLLQGKFVGGRQRTPEGPKATQ